MWHNLIPDLLQWVVIPTKYGNVKRSKRAPTWSWASLDCAVGYFDDLDPDSEIRSEVEILSVDSLGDVVGWLPFTTRVFPPGPACPPLPSSVPYPSPPSSTSYPPLQPLINEYADKPVLVLRAYLLDIQDYEIGNIFESRSFESIEYGRSWAMIKWYTRRHLEEAPNESESHAPAELRGPRSGITGNGGL
jgi:hypothetical protein